MVGIAVGGCVCDWLVMFERVTIGLSGAICVTMGRFEAVKGRLSA